MASVKSSGSDSLRRSHSQTDSLRRSRTDSWRRSRAKTVVSRRFSSYSSQNDEEGGDGFEDEEDEYMSCFEDISDREYEGRFGEEVEDTSVYDSLRDDVQLRQEGGDKVSSVRSRSSHLQDGEIAVTGDFFEISDERDFHRQDSQIREDIDFTDMAISRDNDNGHGGCGGGGDNPDMGLGRADPNFKQRQRVKHEEKIPRLRRFKPTVKFGWFDIVIGVIAIIVFFIDIGTDIELAAYYLREEMWMYGGVTLALIIAPSLITCFLGFHWYMIDYRKEKALVSKLQRAKKRAYITPRYVWFIRFACTLLQIGPVVRIIEYLRNGHKSRCSKLKENERRRFYLFMLYEDVDSCLLRLFESFLESAPQLTWQLYITIVLKPSDDAVGTTIRCVALLSSWGSLAISLVSYHKSLRNSHDDKAKMSVKSLPFYFLWRASEVGGRVICIAIFASTFQLWVFGPLLFHWVFMSCWLMIQKTTFYKDKCLEKAFNVICGYVMIFCFLNLREGVTRYRFLFFYIIMYCENFFMLGLWFRFSPDLGMWYHIWGFIVVLMLFIIHIMFQLMYYALLHPTGNIQLCMSCDPYIIYSSTCYEVYPARKNTKPETYTRNYPPEQEIIFNANGHHRSDSCRSERVEEEEEVKLRLSTQV